MAATVAALYCCIVVTTANPRRCWLKAMMNPDAIKSPAIKTGKTVFTVVKLSRLEYFTVDRPERPNPAATRTAPATSVSKCDSALCRLVWAKLAFFDIFRPRCGLAADYLNQ